MLPGAMLGVHLFHAYPHTTGEVLKNFTGLLKGADKLVYDAFVGAGIRVTIRPYFHVDVDNFMEKMSENLAYSWDHRRWGDIRTWVSTGRDPDVPIHGERPWDRRARCNAIKDYRRLEKLGFNRQELELSFMGNQMMALVTPKDGEGVDGEEKHAWEVCQDLGELLHIIWLNKATHRKEAIIHGMVSLGTPPTVSVHSFRDIY